jgi:hypothetical protein
MKKPDTIEDKIFDWIGDYVPDKNEANGVAGLIINLVHKHAKKCAALGFLGGIIFTILMLKWLS